MIRFARLRVVAEFEFLSALRRRSYLIATFGLPLFGLAYAAFVGLIADMGEASLGGTGVFAVVDEGGVLGDAAGATGDEVGNGLYLYDSMDVATQDLLSGALDQFYRIPADFVERGVLDVYFRESLPTISGRGDKALDRLLLRSLLSGHVDSVLVERASEPIETRNEWAIAADGTIAVHSGAAQLVMLAVPMVFVSKYRARSGVKPPVAARWTTASMPHSARPRSSTFRTSPRMNSAPGFR